MRGKLAAEHRERDVVRIIPAHAGQTDWGCGCGFAYTDHPRACGANANARAYKDGADGSSPRMRGKPTFAH